MARRSMPVPIVAAIDQVPIQPRAFAFRATEKLREAACFCVNIREMLIEVALDCLVAEDAATGFS